MRVLTTFPPRFWHADLHPSHRYAAAAYGQVATIAQLLDAGAAVDLTRLSPLSMAVRRGHRAAALELVDAGATLTPTQVGGRSPLYLAVQKEHRAAVAELDFSATDSQNGQKGDAEDVQEGSCCH